jgi:TPP-dependent 2-oxoacid decarboxylase
MPESKLLLVLFTAYGVWELSAINVIAGSYAEYAPSYILLGRRRGSIKIRRGTS